MAEYDVEALLTEIRQVSDTDLPEEKRKSFRQYIRYLNHHREHLRDYREILREAGVDITGMRPMGSAEAQMRVMAKRTKRGGYSWSIRGVRAMFKTIIRYKEGWDRKAVLHKTEAMEPEGMAANMKEWLREVKQTSKGCLNGVIRLLKGPMQNSPTGMALKGLRGF